MIKDFVPNETVTAYLSVRKRDIREYSGSSFITFEFGDASGRIAGVWWEPDKFALEELEEGAVVKIKGILGDYKGNPQLKITKLRLAKEDEYDISQIIPRSKFSEEDLKSKILSLTGKIENGNIKKLADSFWNDQDLSGIIS